MTLTTASRLARSRSNGGASKMGRMKDVGDGVVQEARVVGDDDRCVVSEASKVTVVLKPSDVNNIQVISWLVE